MRNHVCLIVSVAVLCLAPMSLIAGGGWEEDFEKAAATAKAQNRFMLLDFSGSDWCGWCMKLDKEVFGKNDFKTYAKDNLVCVIVDFPRGKSLAKKQKQQNEALAGKYEVKGYPTVIILSPDGKQVHQTGYQEGGPAKYVKMLDSVISEYRKENNIGDPVPAAGGRQARPASRRPGTAKAGKDKPAAEEDKE